MRLPKSPSYLKITAAASQSGKQTASALAITVIVALSSPAFGQNAADGSHIFRESGCFVCHGEMGNGGAGPGLRGDPFLSITDYVVAQILLGRNIMPAFGEALSDQQIAQVASYIRNNWGNHFGTVDPQEVARLRKQFQSMNVTAMGPPPPSSGNSASPH